MTPTKYTYVSYTLILVRIVDVRVVDANSATYNLKSSIIRLRQYTWVENVVKINLIISK